ncbi:hypothetical protein [Caldibacillus debilis]|uniref:Uncharacterized protein n=1 Tax=Caldibacillus debilis GB1 TaxID=1339248 RepID=A0A420VEB0_9BACI|nr:hypothetical protein [Caldibacillus debilis]RKO61693.1 hypothetical protein Cdeb_01164 [Caldibacillus debilis GB1]
MEWTKKRKLAVFLGMVGLYLAFILAIFWWIDGPSIDYKSDEDRMVVTDEELETIRKKTLEMDGVKGFTIDQGEEGLNGELVVRSKKEAKTIAEYVFALMVAETSDSVDLFVKLDDKEGTILIQAYKPAGEDHFFEWDILY